MKGPSRSGACCNPVPPCRPLKTLRAKREVVSKWVAALAVGVLALALTYFSDLQPLMPGPITTAHSTLENCSDCHSNVSAGPFGWLHTVLASADAQKTSAACLTCHQLGPTALNPHGLELARLEAYTRYLETTEAASAPPTPARIRSTLFPVENARSEGVFCATCHKEHQGKTFDLKAMTNDRCHSCHTVQFESFHTDHPNFNNYPFRRRTRIAFDHSSHFDKHFPETRAKQDPAYAIPGACADCHTTGSERGLMAVKPFEQTCSSCHLGQIAGTERATGPKGIALIALPGLDVETLKEKNIAIGEWPLESEAEITPFMKLLIGWDAQRRQLLADIDELDLLDLTDASPQDLAAVEQFAWEVKDLIYALSTTGTSDVLNRLGPATGARIDPDLIAKLTANMPRDVLLNAQREWLPGLPEEINKPRDELRVASVEQEEPGGAEAAAAPAETEAEGQESAGPSGQGEGRESDAPGDGVEAALPGEGADAAEADASFWKIDALGRLVRTNAQGEPLSNAGDNPEEESTEQEPEPAEEPAEPSVEETPESEAPDAPDPAVEVDAESWAKLGGWYRQDFSILYRPAGHADAFLRTWLEFSGRLYSEAKANLASPVFNQLTAEDAQGQCTKCHSVDALENKSRLVNWSPASLATRESLFTSFAHEPHFGLLDEKKGCLACHDVNKAKGFRESYKAHDPYSFVPNFKSVDKAMCATCHGQDVAREDCLLCHKYHVNGVGAPITATRIPDK